MGAVTESYMQARQEAFNIVGRRITPETCLGYMRMFNLPLFPQPKLSSGKLKDFQCKVLPFNCSGRLKEIVKQL